MSNKYKNFILNQKGMFLGELMAGIIIMTIIMAVLFGIMNATSKTFLYNTAQSNNIAGARNILDTVTTELRYATAISDPVFPSGQDMRIDYYAGAQLRHIYTVTGNPATTSSLVIDYNGVIQKTIAINNLQSIQFKRDATNTQILNVSVQLNNYSYSNSPSLLSSFVITMPNM